MPTVSPLALAIVLVALVIPGALLVLANFRRSSLFRGYADNASDLRGIARRLDGSKIVRTGDDIVVAGELQGVQLSIRFSHSDSSPGVYIRCAAQADFSLTIEARTAENGDAADVCRTGDVVFDRRFVARTDNRVRTKQLLSQPACPEHLQQLCCSNKTMLRIAADAVEVSEALIPSDTERHITSHIESLVALNGSLASMRAPFRSENRAASRGSAPLAVRAAILAAIVMVLVVGVLVFARSSKKLDAVVDEPSAQNTLSSSLNIPNPNGWAQAEPKDLDPEFVEWLKGAGVTPQSKITLDANNDGNPASTAYILRARTDERMKRVVWIQDRRVLFDLVGTVDGVTRIPKEALTKITWAEGATPAFTPDGDALLVVRDHTKPNTATVYFTSGRVLHTAIPANFNDISLL